MAQNPFGVSVQGFSHKRSGKECQDSLSWKRFPGGQVSLAVADGHGSNSCPYSKTGSRFAARTFREIMSVYCSQYESDMEALLTFLNREGDTKIAQEIDKEWKRKVLKEHEDNGREQRLNGKGEPDLAAIYGQYGTTLLGLLITPSFVFAFQLGDGDMAYISDSGVEPLIVTEKILGTETHSLSKPDSWKKAITLIKRTIPVVPARPYAFMLTTDGFANSYASQEEYIKSVEGYFSLMKEHGTDAVRKNLEQWLSETSEMGCGDDITALIAYYNG